MGKKKNVEATASGTVTLEVPVVEKKNDVCEKYVTVLSRANYPIKLKIGKEEIMIPPRGIVKDIDPSRLVERPKGLLFI